MASASMASTDLFWSTSRNRVFKSLRICSRDSWPCLSMTRPPTLATHDHIIFSAAKTLSASARGVEYFMVMSLSSPFSSFFAASVSLSFFSSSSAAAAAAFSLSSSSATTAHDGSSDIVARLPMTLTRPRRGGRGGCGDLLLSLPLPGALVGSGGELSPLSARGGRGGCGDSDLPLPPGDLPLSPGGPGERAGDLPALAPGGPGEREETLPLLPTISVCARALGPGESAGERWEMLPNCPWSPLGLLAGDLPLLGECGDAAPAPVGRGVCCLPVAEDGESPPAVKVRETLLAVWQISLREGWLSRSFSLLSFSVSGDGALTRPIDSPVTLVSLLFTSRSGVLSHWDMTTFGALGDFCARNSFLKLLLLMSFASFSSFVALL
mmetsp:Transcript_22655/g.89630  ORF Transcript_22655/g.89630 Transcript_22655/m.89630 type:complete len:381 (+) Transcript_22655:1301-2443(+)